MFDCKKVYQSKTFFKHRNQLRPISILNHAGDVDFGHSRFANLKNPFDFVLSPF